MADESKSKKIGEMNGPWAILLRVCLIMSPIATIVIIPWSVWVTGETFANQSFRTSGDRFTAADATKMETRINEKIADMPSPDFRKRFDSLESMNQKVLEKIAKIEGYLERNPKP